MAGVHTVIPFIILNFVVRHGHGYTLNDSMTLMNDMLSGYDRRHRPIINQSLPVSVSIVLLKYKLQPNFNGSNLFETMKICSR